MAAPVYYHETIDVTPVREKEVEYLRTLGEVVTKIVNTPASEMRNYGKWVLVWATGRWPQVVGQWEMASWDWFAKHFEVFSLEVDHPEGFEQYRSGGFDRLLVPYEGTPSLDEVVEHGVRAPYVLQETVTTAVGRAGEYLDALRAQSLGWLRALPPDDLNRIVDLKALRGGKPEHMEPVVWEEIADLNGIPLWQFLARPCVMHIRVHYGEVTAQLEALRAAATPN